MVKVNFRFEYFTQPGQSVVISDGSKVLTTLAYCHPGYTDIVIVIVVVAVFV
eukprot:Awhi_evm1s2129